MPRPKIFYLAHDLDDPSIGRRAVTLTRGGADVSIYGFRRGGGTANAFDVPTYCLGQTHASRRWHRALAIARRALTARRWAADMPKADLIVARNLDNLALASAARLLTGSRAPLVYELLDVQPMMVRPGPASFCLRLIERGLLALSAATWISSPAFEQRYLAVHYPRRPKSILIENKVDITSATPPRAALPPGPPWRIGWFGTIRCPRGLRLLCELAERQPHLLEVDIRGTFARHIDMQEVNRLLGRSRNVRYLGPYKYPDDLADAYARVHFSWVIDLLQRGDNSDWLLPNRLYEGSLCGAIPLALTNTETGRWLEQRQIGIRLDEPLEDSLPRFLERLTAQEYLEARAKLLAVDAHDLLWIQQDCDDLVRQTTRFATGGSQRGGLQSAMASDSETAVH